MEVVLFYPVDELFRCLAHEGFEFTLEMCLVGVAYVLDKFRILTAAVCKNLIEGMLESKTFAQILRTETI